MGFCRKNTNWWRATNATPQTHPGRAKNKRGHAHFTLKLSDRVNRGTLVTEGIWWQAYTKDGNTNRLTSMRLTDKDGGSTFYDVSIDIEKA